MTTVVKVDFGGDIRRLAVAEPLTFEHIVDQVASAWPQALKTGATLKYQDEEADWCTLTAGSMEDLLQLQPVGNSQQRVLKLRLLHPSRGLAAPATAGAAALTAPVLAAEPTQPSPPPTQQPSPSAAHVPEVQECLPTPSAPPLPDNAAATTGQPSFPQPSAPPAPSAPQQPQAVGVPPRFPIEIHQTHVVPAGGSHVEVSVKFSIWSVWPEGFGVAGCSWQASVSPWIPSSELQVQFPAGTCVRNMWSAEVVRTGPNNVLTVKLAPWPTTCFGGNLGLRGDPCSCTERLMETLGGR